MRSRFENNGRQNTSKRSFDNYALLTKSVVLLKQHLTKCFVIIALFADTKIYLPQWINNICELTISRI